MRASVVFLTVLGVVGLVASAQAGVITAGTYILLDHPDAHLFKTDHPCCDDPVTGDAGPYGLRYDALAPAGPGPTYSVSSNGAYVELTWAGGMADATIEGDVWRNDTQTLHHVTYTLTDFFDTGLGGPSWNSGTGLLSDPIIGGTPLSGKVGGPNNTAFDFLPDCHRLPCYGAGMTPVARGWLDAPGTNDWLVIAQKKKVPEPATLLLFGTGLAAVAYRRRSQRRRA